MCACYLITFAAQCWYPDSVNQIYVQIMVLLYVDLVYDKKLTRLNAGNVINILIPPFIGIMLLYRGDF